MKPFAKLLTALILGATALCASAVTPAGTDIVNRGQANFLDTRSGLHSATTSNGVSVSVAPFEAVTLLPDSHVRTVVGGRVTYVQRVRNAGNTRSEFQIRVQDAPNDALALGNLTSTRDLNGNGIVDPGEPRLAEGEAIDLAAGTSADLVIQADVAGTPAIDASTVLSVQALSTSRAARATARHSTDIADGPVFQVSKSAASRTANQGDRVAFRLVAFNTGSRAVGFPVTVDGTTQRLLLLRDAIPANTTLLSVTGSSGGRSLYHLRGDKTHAYRSAAGPDLSQVDAVALAWSELDSQVTVSADLTVVLNANAAGTIRNTAALMFADPREPGAARTNPSNTARVRVPGTGATLTFTKSASSSDQNVAMRRGKKAFLRLDAGVCNADPNRRETAQLQIAAKLSQDSENAIAIETGVNSGIFRIALATADIANEGVVRGDGTLQVSADDELEAWGMGCAADADNAAIGVDPNGVVFDSKTNVPVAGARVTLIDITGAGNNGQPQQPAIVFDVDGVTLQPSSVVTGPDGRFAFPIVRPSLYRLVVIPPNDYTWASVLPPGVLPAGRTILADGSYGRPFPVNFATGVVTVDLPIDIKPPGGMDLRKTASRSNAQIGDIVSYELVLRNISGAGLGDVVMRDDMPAGFAYVQGSARLNGTKVAHPVYASARQLAFAKFDLADGAQATLSYRLRIAPTARAGSAVNSAQATSLLPIRRLSNVARARVRIDEGVFSSRVFVLGKVFLDCDANRLQDAGEPGIPGVRIYLEDGRFAVTDSGGKYNFAGVAPRTHVAKLDRTTLPAGATLEVLDNRNAGDAASRFVDLRPGALQRADFASPTCTPTVRADIGARRQQLEQAGGRGVKSDELKPLGFGQTPVGDLRGQPASRSVDLPAGSPGAASGSAAEAGSVPDSGARAVALEVLLPALNAEPAVLDLTDGTALPTALRNLRIKGDANLKLRLELNGKAVARERIGKTLVDRKRGVQLTEFVGVQFTPGANQVRLLGSDKFGIERVREQYTVMAPGRAGRIEIGQPTQALPADGKTRIAVTIALRDARGLAVGERSTLTLHADAGVWLVPDADATQAGIQTYITGGEQVYYLRAPAKPADTMLRVEHGELRAEQAFAFVTAPRPLIVAGLIEAAIGRGASGPSGGKVFERELSGLLDADATGRTRSGTRAAVFAKGEIAPGRELTLGYDSAKDPDEPQFRDRQPDQGYPVYGDASAHGYDAQSSGKLYARIDQGKSYLAWGDFITPRARGAHRLGAYGRSLNGLNGRYDKGGLRVDGFLTRADSRQLTREFAADGTSGPFNLDTESLVPGSERVELVTRDRAQSQRILSVSRLSRPLDYEIDEVDGSLLLRAPVASLDEDGNPVSIRLRYEVEQDGPRFWVGGLKASYALTATWTLGGSVVVDRNPVAGLRLASANVTWQPGKQTQVRAELARLMTDGDEAAQGNAARIELRHEGDGYKLRAYTERSDASFDNPSADLAAGRTEAGARLVWQADDYTQVIADARHSANRITGQERQRVTVGVKRKLEGRRVLELGIRGDRESHADTTGKPINRSRSDISARARLSSPLPADLPGTAFIEAEHSLRNSGRRTLAIGGDYRLTDRVRAYGRHELVSSPNPFSNLETGENRHATVVGVDTRAFGEGRSYSEYRVREAVDGRRAEAAVGLRRAWDTGSGLRLDGAFERVKSLGGGDDAASGDHISIALGAGYRTSPVWKGSARVERKIGRGGNGSWLVTAGATRKLNEDWVALGKMVWNRTDGTASSASRLRQRVRLGVAYRDAQTNRANGLARYEMRRQKDGSASQSSQVVSAHGDYRVSPDLTLSGHGAAKWVSDLAGGQRASTRTVLLGARLTWDITPRWDVSVSASRLFDRHGGYRNGVGLELGYRIDKNLWVAAGVTRAGQRDSDLGGPSWTGSGVYIRLRFKFDEDMFRFGGDAR